MKKKFEDLRENLIEFVEQTDYACLLIGCTPDEAPYVAQFLQGIDGSHPDDYVLTFVEAFTTAREYLDLLAKRLSDEVESANDARRERGEAPLPAPLADSSARERSPAERLDSLLRYLASLLPNGREHSFVASFLPFDCRDNDAFCELMGSVLPLAGAHEWMAPLRIVVYDDRRERQLVRLSQQHPSASIVCYEVDFSTPALTDALSRDAADPSLPLSQRMASLLQLAALDFSHQRFEAAIQKYGVVHEYYRDPPVPAMQVLCLQGLGDALHALGRSVDAKPALQSALAVALEHRVSTLLVPSLLSMLAVCAALGHHADAESYAESGRKAAEASLNAPVYVTFVEKKGDAQLAQGKPAEAADTYRKCAALAELYELFSSWTSVLQKLAALYRAARMRAEVDATERELRRAEAIEAKRSSSHGSKLEAKPTRVGAAA